MARHSVSGASAVTSLTLIACCMTVAGCGQSNAPTASAGGRPSAAAAVADDAGAGDAGADDAGAGETNARQQTSALQAPALNGQEARRFAAAVNLRASDVPGYTVQKPAKQKHTLKETPAETKFVHCARGVPPSRTLAEYSSATFRRQLGPAFEQVQSSVSAMPTVAMADTDLAAIRRMRAACITKAFDSRIKPTLRGETIAPFKFAKITIGAPEAFGFTVSTTVSIAGRSVPFRFDVVGFVTGSAEVSLSTMAMAVAPDSATEARLLRSVMTRARGSYP